MERNPLFVDRPDRQRGATLAEFLITAPLVLFVGMTTVQAGLIFHGKTTLNYATFEAARTGATNNARLELMRKELGIRLAPLQGGDGSAQSAARAVAQSTLSLENGATTHVQVLNPTTAAFDDWGIQSREYDRRVLPNSHLRHRDYRIGDSSGLSLRDANLLKIEVTHGIEMKVPFVNTLISRAMMLVDAGNSHHYRLNRFPLKSVATVRMQSEAWEDEIVLASLAPEVADESSDDWLEDPSTGQIPAGGGDNGGDEGSDGEGTDADGVEDGDDQADEACEGGDHGLGEDPVLIDASDYLSEDQCPAESPVYGPTDQLPSPDSDACA